MYVITTHELDGSIVRYDLVGLPPDAVAENAEQVGMEEVVAAVEANAIKPARPTSRSPVFTRGKNARMSTEATHGSPDRGAGVLEWHDAEDFRASPTPAPAAKAKMIPTAGVCSLLEPAVFGDLFACLHHLS